MQRVAAALRTDLMVGGDHNNLMALIAHSLSGNVDNFQLGLPGDTVFRYHSKKEAQRFLFNTSQLTDFQPYRFDLCEFLFNRGLFDEL